MVSVTTKNFDEQIKFFAEKLSTCSFVAFDEEMTGIMLDPECTPKNSDTIEERYQKMKKVASTYNIMQVGFCFFHEQDDGSFLGTPFNFFVFPGENSGQTIQAWTCPAWPYVAALMTDLKQMDASTAAFHRKNCMNFNEWIYFGVPFVNCSKFDEDVEKVNAAQEDDGSKDSKKRLSISNKKDKDFIAFVLKRLDSWIEEKRGGGKAEALPQVDGADGDVAADGSMEVESTADGAATAPPAEAEAQEATADADAAAEPAASAETMEVEGEATEEPKLEGEAAEEPKLEGEAAEEPKLEGEAAEEPKADASSADVLVTEGAPAEPHDSAIGEAATDGEAVAVEGAAAAVIDLADDEPAPAAAKAEAAEPVFPEPRHEGDAFVIPECNSFLRKAFYQEIRAHHPTLFLNSAAGNNKLKEIYVTLEPNADSKEKKLEEMQKQSGFRQVYLLLAESKKPLVGHNCLFDLLFLYSHFEDELPDTLGKWKKELHGRFPTIYDTKVIGTALGYGDTALPKLSQSAAAVSGAPSVAVDPEYNEYVSKDGLHEAGFDAWLTGSVFARLGGREILADADNKYKNRLHLSRSLQLLNLAGKDELVSGAIFHSSFPDSTVTKELVDFFGSPLQVSGVPARVTAEEFATALAKFGEVEFSVLAPSPDGKSSRSGFVAFKDAEHATAAQAAVNDSKGLFEGGDGEESALKCAPLRVSVQWIDDSSAYLVLPTCTNEEGAALLADRSAKSSLKVLTLEDFKEGSHGAGKQAGGKRGRQSGSHANDTPSKGGKKGKAAKEDDAPKADATTAKDRKSAAAEAAEDGAAGGRGGRKRGRASTEEAAEEEVAPKKSARAGGRHSKASAEVAHEEKEEEKEEEKKEEKEETPAVAASPEKQPADKSTKRGGKAAAKSGGGRAAKRGGKAAAEEANEEEEKEEKHEEEKEASPAKPVEASPPAKPAGGRAGKRGAKPATTEEKAEETAAAPSTAQPTGGRAAKRGAAASKEEKEEEADKMEEDEEEAEKMEEEEEKPQKGGKGKGRKGKDTKAAPKAEPAPAAATGKSPRGKAAAAAESPAPAEDESKGRRRSGRR